MSIFQRIKTLFFKHTKIFVCAVVILCASIVSLNNIMSAKKDDVMMEATEEVKAEETASEENDAQNDAVTEESTKDSTAPSTKEVAAKDDKDDSKKKVLMSSSTAHEGTYKCKSYDHLYPDLYCTRPETQITPNKTIFLTFDDGPSQRTAEALDILKENGIKATFFVTGCGGELGKKMMKRIVEEGHTLAIHTYTHEFKSIYRTVESYLDDFNKIYKLVYETTGVKPTLFRFPGGSKNSFNKHNYREIIAEMTRRGFDYFDWNLSVGDAVSRTPTPVERCVSNVLSNSGKCAHGVVLMHDAAPKKTTIEALPKLIEGLRAQGFTFDKLTNNIDPAPYSLARPYR